MSGPQDKSVAVVGWFLFIRSKVYGDLVQEALLALYENSPMISMTFAPSVIAFGRFVIGESWTAREKLGCPARVYDWDS
jgi:hypothetical protein